MMSPSAGAAAIVGCGYRGGQEEEKEEERRGGGEGEHRWDGMDGMGGI